METPARSISARRPAPRSVILSATLRTTVGKLASLATLVVGGFGGPKRPRSDGRLKCSSNATTRTVPSRLLAVSAIMSPNSRLMAALDPLSRNDAGKYDMRSTAMGDCMRNPAGGLPRCHRPGPRSRPGRGGRTLSRACDPGDRAGHARRSRRYRRAHDRAGSCGGARHAFGARQPSGRERHRGNDRRGDGCAERIHHRRRRELDIHHRSRLGIGRSFQHRQLRAHRQLRDRREHSGGASRWRPGGISSN